VTTQHRTDPPGAATVNSEYHTSGETRVFISNLVMIERASAVLSVSPFTRVPFLYSVVCFAAAITQRTDLSDTHARRRTTSAT